MLHVVDLSSLTDECREKKLTNPSSSKGWGLLR